MPVAAAPSPVTDPVAALAAAVDDVAAAGPATGDDVHARAEACLDVTSPLGGAVRRLAVAAGDPRVASLLASRLRFVGAAVDHDQAVDIVSHNLGNIAVAVSRAHACRLQALVRAWSRPGLHTVVRDGSGWRTGCGMALAAGSDAGMPLAA